MHNFFVPNSKILKVEDIHPEGELLVILHNVLTGKDDIQSYKNLVTDVGKEAIADALRGNTANNRGAITYCAVGTNALAPANANTQLGSELYRKLVSVRATDPSIPRVATFQTFFNVNEANGALKEAGLFGGLATATTNSGTLFCHTAINRTKTTADTLTILWRVRIG